MKELTFCSSELLKDKTVAFKEGVVDPAFDSKQVVKESSYWNNFYAGKFDIAIPSQFCVLVATEADKSRPVVEFGCGNGRDSIYLARHGFTVFAGDLSKQAVKKNTAKEAECKEHAARHSSVFVTSPTPRTCKP